MEEYLPRTCINGHTMQSPGDTISKARAMELIRTSDITSLGIHAYEKKQRVSGDKVYYLSKPSSREPISLERQRENHSNGVETDVVISYGSDPDNDVIEALEEVKDLQNEAGGVRCVEVVPTETTTAYDDLRVVGVSRLYLDGVDNIRVSSGLEGKLVQTALEFGADDIGFEGDYEHSAELLISEAGFTPLEREPLNHD